MKYELSEIAHLCGGCLAGCDSTVESVVTDSRSLTCELGVSPLFVAMRGANHDSHEFIPEMRRRGVRAFLVERTPEPEWLGEGCGFVQVANALQALQRLAADWRSRFRGTLVGITGSNGKTIIKEWIAEEAPAGVRLYRSPKSYNSQLGVPLSLLMLEGTEEVALIEAGISQPGEMERLERMIRPDVAIFTSIGDAHQEHFESLAQKCEEKMLLARDARTIIYHAYYEPLAGMIERSCADRRLVDAARYGGTPAATGGEAMHRNGQIVEAFCAAMGWPAPSFRCEPSVAMRLEVKDGINDSILVDDAYNLDINSLALALDYLHTVAAGRPKTLVLSDIVQSGLSDDELYGRVAAMVSRAGIGKLIGIGPRIRTHAAKFTCEKQFFATADECAARIVRDDVAGHALLLKGAREFRFEKLSHTLERKSHTTILEVDLDAMTHNLNYFRSKLRFGTKLVAMVKAGSYGAGDFEVAQLLQHEGVSYLAVAFADEGVLLRERGITMPIVVLNADAGSFPLMVANRLEPEIYSFHSLEDFVAAVERADETHYPIHIKLDTGMHRLGFLEEELPRLGELLRDSRRVQVASTFSHLNCSDMPEEDEYTRAQIARFDRMSSTLAALLPYRILRHTANSAAIERFPEAQFDMCRLGLGLYGFGYCHNAALRPVSTLRTRIVQLKRLPAGETIGYGRAGRLTRESLIATVPIGYADGLDRRLGCGRWSMWVGGRPAPIVGRVCMDSCMLDVTDVAGVQEGDEAVVFSPVAGNDLETMARLLETIPYEIMTSVSSRVKRIYLKE